MRPSATDRRFAYYPAFLDLRLRHVVVVGGGQVATEKVRGLLPCGPDPLIVIAPTASDLIRTSGEEGSLRWLARDYRDGDLSGAFIAFAATDSREVNARVAAEARGRGIPILAVDDGPNCDFIAPAIVKRGDLVVAVSTGGRSPAMARRAREHLETLLPEHWSVLLDVAALARDRLGPERARVAPDRWQEAMDHEVEHAACEGRVEAAVDLLLAKLRAGITRVSQDQPFPGLVSLVGAGPGDPELLTLKGLRRLQEADVVVHDRLAAVELLEHCKPGCERIDVGKMPGRHATQQHEIDALLVRLGREGRRVVRLKGGDPFVFGRGGEEALALAAAGVPFEIVPGISSALAAPAAAGIPVTHRGLAASVTIVSGHRRQPGDPENDWAVLARTPGTLVFLMAVENLHVIVAGLLHHGRDPNEAAALVRWGTSVRQTVLSGCLGSILEQARQTALQPPAVLVIGPVVSLAERLAPLAPPSQERLAGEGADLQRIRSAKLG